MERDIPLPQVGASCLAAAYPNLLLPFFKKHPKLLHLYTSRGAAGRWPPLTSQILFSSVYVPFLLRVAGLHHDWGTRKGTFTKLTGEGGMDEGHFLPNAILKLEPSSFPIPRPAIEGLLDGSSPPSHCTFPPLNPIKQTLLNLVSRWNYKITEESGTKQHDFIWKYHHHPKTHPSVGQKRQTITSV